MNFKNRNNIFLGFLKYEIQSLNVNESWTNVNKSWIDVIFSIQNLETVCLSVFT